MKNIEKYLDKLKKILEEDMLKLKLYMKNKNIISENMKEHIILSYARAIYLQGKFCKLKKQITDAASIFNIGINLLKQNINKSIESETFALYAKFLLSLSCILIEDNSYIIASEKIVFGINFFIKALFLTIDNPNGINIEDIQRKIKNNSFILSIKGLIISLFLLGICLERLDLLDNALTLYNQSYWLFKKFFKNIDPIFFSIIESITNRINKFQEDIHRELRNKYIQEKKLEKMRIIEEKNLLKAIRLTNISNRGSFNSERYLKMEKRLKNILNTIEKKYGRKDEDGKMYLPIIKYLNFEKNKFDFTFNFLVKEKEKQMENKIKIKSNSNKSIKNLNTENNINNNKKNFKLFKSFNTNFSNKNIYKKRNNKNEICFNSYDINNNIKLFKTKTFSPKGNLKKIMLEKKNQKYFNYEEIKSESNEHFDTKPDSNIFKSNSLNTNLTTYNTNNNKNSLFKTLKNYNSFDNKIKSNIFDSNKNNNIKQYILSNKKQKSKQKEFLTKNSFVFCKSFRKGIKYLEKMDKREMDFQKQLINLKDLELGYEEELENIKNLKGDFSKEKIKEEAEYIYLNIKDKIDDKFKNDNNIEITGTNEKSKELEKIMIQKMKLENSLIMGLNEAKIDEIRKLEQYLEEINRNQYIKMLNTSYLNAKKNANNNNQILNDIEYANKKNNQMMDSLDNEIIRCEQKNMAFKKNKKKFYLPTNLKKYKINA